MLPSVTFTRARTTAITAVAALAMAVTAAAPVQALDKSERSFLKGVAATLFVGALVSQANRNRARAPRSAFVEQPTHTGPVYGNPVYGSVVGQSFAEFSPASKRAIQSRLRAYGYYTGSVDGVFGQGTRSAIEAYARDTGNTGALTTRNGTVTLLNSLLA